MKFQKLEKESELIDMKLRIISNKIRTLGEQRSYLIGYTAKGIASLKGEYEKVKT